jgi:PAS domain S-box-containing protein
MIFINYQAKVVYANKKCEEKLGYTREEFYSPNFNFLSLISPEDVELLKAAYARHMRGKDVPSYEYGLVTRHGMRINAIITTKLIDYEGEMAILGIVTDITCCVE